MADRRSLVEGLMPTTPVDSVVEKAFVFGTSDDKATEPAPPLPLVSTQSQPRSPLSTRIRSDFASALKRASLERQLSGTVPHTVQDILEEALEPWLRANGYLV